MTSVPLDPFAGPRRHFRIGFCLMMLVLAGGTLGYYLLGQGQWSWDDCLYMTAISITTVGYGEILDVAAMPGARLYTVVLIVSGMGIIVYFASTAVALVVEGQLKHYFGRKRMQKEIAGLSSHVIVCGAGSTGGCVIKELAATGAPFVVIEESEERIRRLQEDGMTELHYLIGDADSDAVLTAAGIERAAGLIAALPNDKDNLFVVVSARQLNRSLRIVSRGIEPNIADKLRRAGADAVVSPNSIGGLRMASEMIRPHVVQFLDLMLRDTDKTLRFDEVTLPQNAPCIGRTLAQAGLRSLADILVVALRHTGGAYTYNPGPEHRLQAGQIMIVLGRVDEVQKLRRALSA